MYSRIICERDLIVLEEKTNRILDIYCIPVQPAEGKELRVLINCLEKGAIAE